MQWFFWIVGSFSLGLVLGFFLCRKRFFASFKEWESIGNLLIEGIVIFRADGKVGYVNSAASKMFFSSRKNLLGKPLQGTQPLIQKSLSVLEASFRCSFPVTDSFSDDLEKKRYLDLIAVPFSQNRGCLILQDRSSQQKMLEVGKDFVSNASHELKTPITIIRGFAETLQDMKQLPRQIVEDILEKIVRNCKRMDSLVKNLLTLADIENLPLSDYGFCDIFALLQDCKNAVLTVYPSAEIVITKEKNVLAEVEKNILELAILNLLENAAKYSQSPAKISISLRQEKDLVVISIQDQGVGIAPEDVEHIFDRFYTVNKAHSRKLGGAGLGLSLVKTIIEKHDGSIHVSSKLGQGSTFTISFPRVRRF